MIIYYHFYYLKWVGYCGKTKDVQGRCENWSCPSTYRIKRIRYI
jgi:hypothetical protein